jgi:hypothetical protein
MHSWNRCRGIAACTNHGASAQFPIRKGPLRHAKARTPRTSVPNQLLASSPKYPGLACGAHHRAEFQAQYARPCSRPATCRRTPLLRQSTADKLASHGVILSRFYSSPLIGRYKVFAYVGEPRVGRLATNAPFRVVAEHVTQTVAVNLQQGAGEWKLLGTFDNPRHVELSNAADGVVVADAVRFDRIHQ